MLGVLSGMGMSSFAGSGMLFDSFDDWLTSLLNDSFLFVAIDEVLMEIPRKTISRRKNFVFMIDDFDKTKLALAKPLSQGRNYGK